MLLPALLAYKSSDDAGAPLVIRRETHAGPSVLKWANSHALRNESPLLLLKG
jgi:hypothetical protein